MFGLWVLRLLCLIRNADCSEWKEIFLTRFIWVHFPDKTCYFSTWSDLTGPHHQSQNPLQHTIRRLGADMTSIKCYFFAGQDGLTVIVRFNFNQRLRINDGLDLRQTKTHLDRSIQNRSTDLIDRRFKSSTIKPTLRKFLTNFFKAQSSHSKIIVCSWSNPVNQAIFKPSSSHLQTFLRPSSTCSSWLPRYLNQIQRHQNNFPFPTIQDHHFLYSTSKTIIYTWI